MLYHFGQYTLDPDRLELRRGGQLVDVEPQVFLLLLHLITNRERVVSKDELLNTVWGSRVVSDATLNTRINAVRRAVGDSGKEQKVVRIFPRRGLRFVGEVSEEESRPPASAVAGKSAESKDDDQTEPVDTASIAPDQTVGIVDSGSDNQKKPVAAGSDIGPTEDSKTEGHVDNGSADESRLGATGSERRHLTVMVCELAVSPDLSEQLDPEDFAETTVAYHNACRQIIADFDGFLASARSTTILAYFGYPQAHEDDAERSIRAALRIVDKVGELKACEGTESSVKVGIATGVKLEQLLQQSRAVDVAPLRAALLSISAEDRYTPLGLTPQDQKLQTLQALVQMLEGLAAVSPILFLVKDVHWIDPTTQELLDLQIDRVAALPVLMLVAHRPEFETGWTFQPHCTLLTLNRLGREACADLIDDLAQGLALPEEVFEQIISKTEGVPLFVNELTKTVLASELLVRQEDHYVLSGPLPSLAIPSTLQDSLTAQLDRLDEAKEIAQIGAAIGRQTGDFR